MFSQMVTDVIDRVDRLRHEVDDHYQIPRVEADVLAQIVRVGRFQSLCEIGTSYGFSTLHLAAAAAEHGGHVHSIDAAEKKHQAAGEHLEQAGLRAHVTLHLGPAQSVLPGLQPERPFDFVFLDAMKQELPAYLAAVRPLCASGAVLATDNTHTHPQQLADFVAELRAIAGARSCDVPVGNGFELTVLPR